MHLEKPGTCLRRDRLRVLAGQSSRRDKCTGTRLLYCCRSGHPVVSPDQFLDFVGHLLPQEPYLDLPRITCRELQEVARAEKSAAGGLDGCAWNEIKALPLSWFSGLAILLNLVETSGTWPQGLLDASIAVIPKADGDSTPLGQRPLIVLPVVYRLWLPFGLDICESGMRGGYLIRCLVLVMVSLQWNPGSLLRWILRRFFPGLVVISCMSWSLMSLSPLILLTGPFWIVLWVAWGYLIGFAMCILLFIVKFASGSSLLLDLVSHGVGMVVFPRAVLSTVFIVALCVPWCRHLDSLPDVKPQLYADDLKCSAERPRAPFEAARFPAQHVWSVGQDVSPGKCVLLSTSKSVRKAMKLWDVSGSGGFWKV